MVKKTSAEGGEGGAGGRAKMKTVVNQKKNSKGELA